MDARVTGPSRSQADSEDLFYRPKPDGTIDPIGETGWFLQRERERRGETLEQASETTGIHTIHLEAIESGDLRGMPNRDEALQMVGLYALYMGFEPEPLMAHYAQYLPTVPARSRPSHPADPAPLSSAKIIRFGNGISILGRKLGIRSLRGGSGGIIASCLGAVLLFAGANWLMEPAAEMVSIEQVIESIDPESTASIEPADAEVAVKDEDMPDDGNASASVLPGEQPAVGVEPRSDANGDQGLGGLTALIEKTVGDIPEKKGKAAAPAAKVASKNSNRPAEQSASRLSLKAKAPVWIRIEDGQGDVVMTRMLMPGDTYRVPDREGLVVIARDGGLLLYEIDGQDQGILGTPGEILVGRSLDIKSLDKRG